MQISDTRTFENRRKYNPNTDPNPNSDPKSNHFHNPNLNPKTDPNRNLIPITLKPVRRTQIRKFTYRGDDDCTFGMEAANDAHDVRVNTACGKTNVATMIL